MRDRAMKTDQERVSLAHAKMVVLVSKGMRAAYDRRTQVHSCGGGRTRWTTVCFQIHNEKSSTALRIHIHKNLVSTPEDPYENPIAWLDMHIPHPHSNENPGSTTMCY